MVGPSPKRRRTDNNGPVSADSIAQANSTLQFFTGQRQNRWMAQEHVTDNNGAQRSSVVDDTLNEEGAIAGHFSAQSFGVTDRQSEANAAGATHAPSNPPTLGVVELVDYESPHTSSSNLATSTNTNPTKSLEGMARTTGSAGLPSPAPSDENTNSPMAVAINVPSSTTRPPTNTTDSAPLKRRPGRPRIHNTNVSSSHANSSPAAASISPVAVHQRVPSQTHRPTIIGSSSQTPNMQMDVSAPWTFQPAFSFGPAVRQGTGPQSPAIVPSPRPYVAQQQQTLAQNFSFDAQSMLQRIERFETAAFQMQAARHVDTGRLALLREAIEKEDWFYIALSQIHCLSGVPALLPEPVRAVDSRAFRYLDNLLCPNSEISPVLLNWLACFPAPIGYIYSSGLLGLYDSKVREVSQFLQLLPAHWDRLVADSRNRAAPPLTEDLSQHLGLRSLVLQTTAFRAVARGIWDANNRTVDSSGFENLEHLHRMDQAMFMQGLRRSAEEKGLAYRAYASLLNVWKSYRRDVHVHDKEMERVPEHQRVRWMAFKMPPSVISAFQMPARYSPPTVQSAPPLTQANHPTAARQASRRSHAPAPGPSANGRASPGQNFSAQQSPITHAQVPPAGIPMPRQALPPGVNLMYPHETERGPRAQPTQPEATRAALHQALLRSPTIGTVELQQDAPRLYRSVIAYALSPRKINKDIPVETVGFSVPQHCIDLIPVTLPSGNLGEPPSRILDETSQTYRLRCVAFPPSGFPNESAWVGADNRWPDNLYLSLNDTTLEPRRKLQHGRYLPIDVTTCIKLGENKLTAIVNRLSTDERPYEFALAIEIVGVKSHQSIISNLQTISAFDSLNAIKKSLTCNPDDEDIAITSSSLTISLLDPYTCANINKIPVRGIGCVHRDCFDLETFLATRTRLHPGFPTVVDCWRCPLCRGDVRPQNLVIDGFLAGVREKLGTQNLLGTRAIVIETDGNWSPKAEEQTGVRSPSLEREERGAVQAKAVSARPKLMPEIIEID